MKVILKIAVPTPLRTLFDYLPPADISKEQLQPGIRVRVPFGKKSQIGILVKIESSSQIEPKRLRPVLEILDDQPLLRQPDLTLLEWAARYYHHPVGEVFSAAIPVPLRQGKAAKSKRLFTHLAFTQTGINYAPSQLKNAPRQQALFEILKNSNGLIALESLNAMPWEWHPAARSLAAKGLVEFKEIGVKKEALQTQLMTPNPAQQQAIDTITSQTGQFAPFLLEGVTGSGKTEVYLRVIEKVLAQGRQVLVLFPEIALTPQLQARFSARLNSPVGIYHSGLSPTARLDTWLKFQKGDLPLLLGTRSAVFAPMARPGLIILDEEHDPSFKQQDGFRFSARDVAVKRAHLSDIPIILGSATPSLESLHNALSGRYQHLRLPKRAGCALSPQMKLVDIRDQPLTEGFADSTLNAMKGVLQRKEQVLIFLNRRGYAPVLICNSCGWVATCSRCDAKKVVHLNQRRIRCHHCGHEQPLFNQCPDCGSSQLSPLGQGTQRVEDTLAELFPDQKTTRIDRDNIRRKGALEEHLQAARRGEIDILLGTQMLAKGHHFPDVTLVVILDADSGIYSTDYRAPEQMAQLITQVAGRSGRAEKPGEVLIQTRFPDHPLLHSLLDEGYPGFARQALLERQQAGLPPFSFQAMLRAEASKPETPDQFLSQAAGLARQLPWHEVVILGPAPAPMPKRAGYYRSQLLLQAPTRNLLHKLLDTWIPQVEKLPQARRVRWSLDVDPINLY